MTEDEPCEGPNTRHEPAESDHGEPREGLTDALHRVQPVAQRDAEDGDGHHQRGERQTLALDTEKHRHAQLWLQ